MGLYDRIPVLNHPSLLGSKTHDAERFEIARNHNRTSYPFFK